MGNLVRFLLSLGRFLVESICIAIWIGIVVGVSKIVVGVSAIISRIITKCGMRLDSLVPRFRQTLIGRFLWQILLLLAGSLFIAVAVGVAIIIIRFISNGMEAFVDSLPSGH